MKYVIISKGEPKEAYYSVLETVLPREKIDPWTLSCPEEDYLPVESGR